MTTRTDQTAAALLEAHPCYTEEARLYHGRLHLAVAPQCNLGCRYCQRAIGAPAGSTGGPGTAERVLTPLEAASLVDDIHAEGWLRVVGIAGPGEPLANAATVSTFRLIREAHRDVILCLSTNGLEMGTSLPSLLEVGVRSLTITINAVRTETASQLYDWAAVDGSRLLGATAAAQVLERQWNSLAMAVEAGLLVKVNSILIPGVTDGELESVARRAAAIGAHRHNIMPLIPRGRMRDRRAPTPQELDRVRRQCERWLAQFRGCTQCRADAIIPPLGATGGIACSACA